MNAPARRFALGEVLAWAAQQLTGTEWARVNELVTERNAAIPADPVEFCRSREHRSDAENSRIDQRRRCHATAEQELRSIVDRALAASGLHRRAARTLRHTAVTVRHPSQQG